MAKKEITKKQKRGSSHLPILWHITFSTAGLLALLGFGLTVFTNVATSIRIPAVLTYDLSPTPVPGSGTVPSSSGSEPLTMNSSDDQPSLDQIQQVAIREFRLITLTGIILFSILGGFGTYRIAKKAIYPLHNLNDLIAEIHPGSLHQRIGLNRPNDEIKVLADTFDGMLDRIENAFDQQGRFIADAAHELRTPLANMRANLEVIQMDPMASEEDYRSLSQTFDRSLTRIEHLVEDLLLLAKGEGQFHREMTSVEELLIKVIRETDNLAQNQQVRVNLLSKKIHMAALDGSLFSIALRNLILNAILYNKVGGSVLIDVKIQGKNILITIEDTGIGIPSRHLAHIFERFYRVEPSRATDLGGSGLGLSIAAHIVELHGGVIQVQSEEGIGSCFSICLPNPVSPIPS